jgi:hypothetical protein
MFYIQNVKPVYKIYDREKKVKLIKKGKKQRTKNEKVGDYIKTPTVKHIDILV